MNCIFNYRGIDMRLLGVLCFVAQTLALVVCGCSSPATNSVSTTAITLTTIINTSQQTTSAIPLTTQNTTPAQELASFHSIISGVVQSVGFRDFVRTQAFRFNITGWVQNLPDGTVEVVAEGERNNLEQLIAQLNIGPTGAVVDKVDTSWLPYTGQYNTFTRLN
jgi:acylphosphatase